MVMRNQALPLDLTTTNLATTTYTSMVSSPSGNNDQVTRTINGITYAADDIPNNLDNDDDNDGFLDTEDAFPLTPPNFEIPTETVMVIIVIMTSMEMVT